MLPSFDGYLAPSDAGESEAQFVSRLRRHDEAAFEALVQELGPQMLAVAHRFLPCPHDAADALQEAFVSAFVSMDSFEENSRLGTWLHRITVNSCLMLRRGRGRRRAMEEMLSELHAAEWHGVTAGGRDDTFTQVLTAEQRARVRAWIESLPEPHRSVLLLRDIQEFDTDQTARLLGTTAGTVKTRLHRARQMLQSRVERAGDTFD